MPENRQLAIIGMSFSFPGASDPGMFWRNTVTGTSHIRRFTEDDFSAAGIPAEVYQQPDYSGASALLPGIGDFDARFFGMSSREADLTDPQQRLFLECCYHALENAGYARVPAGHRVGVFASAGYRLYSLHSYLAHNLRTVRRDPDWVTAKQAQVGNYVDFIATRVSHRLGLTGPALTIQTACSSSLVALHLARLSLLAGDADLVLVGASAVHIPEVVGYRHVKGSTLSPSGTLRAFDADADGTVGGNGVAAVVLKLLDRAHADGDTVQAVILGTGVANDGDSTISFAAPSAPGQHAAARRALDVARVPAESIGYVEAHGTGTFKGDPIEFEALSAAYRGQANQGGHCALGTVKPNIGHLDTCAGLAGLIRAVLVLRHAVIPPLAGFRRPNPALALDASPFYIPAEAREWPSADRPRRAGVHSVGMGGTNAHVILEEAPPPAENCRRGDLPTPGILPISAHTERALVEHIRAYRDYLRGNPRTRLADLVTTAALGGPHLRHRLAVRGDGPRELAEALEARLTGSAGLSPAGALLSGGPASGTPAHRVGFLFTGQGSHYLGMAKALQAEFPVVRDALEECEDHYRSVCGQSLLTLLLGTGTPVPSVWPTDTAQPALFSFQVALARLWRDLGIIPELVAGHSVGEYAALCVAGALSLADGLRLTALRGRFIEERTAPGRMAAVFAARSTVDQILHEVPGTELAVVNSECRYVLSFPERLTDQVCRYLDAGEIGYQMLPVTRAFHSTLVEPALGELRAAAGTMDIQPIAIPFLSGLTGEVHQSGWVPGADYFTGQTRQAVRFEHRPAPRGRQRLHHAGGNRPDRDTDLAGPAGAAPSPGRGHPDPGS